MSAVTLTLARHSRPSGQFWAFAQMGLARWPLRRTAGLTFFKLMGSGTGAGFSPVPNLTTWSILCGWRDAGAATAGLRGGVFARWDRRADECCHLLLDPVSVRGAWSGRTPFAAGPDRGSGPIAALTRATIRPRALPRFWRRVPRLDRLIGENPEVLMKVGVGEAPWLHQVTFSVWPDAASMARFARDPAGPHAEAIRAVRDEGWFREELYARFRVRDARGIWQGRDIGETLT